MLARRNERGRKTPPKADNKTNCAEQMTVCNGKTDRKPNHKPLKFKQKRYLPAKRAKKGGEKQPPKADDKKNCAELMTVGKTKPTKIQS